MASQFEKHADWCALYIDGDLQFDSRDERTYHECLALPALALAEQRLGGDLKALVIGGGDGLTIRELLKSAAISQIDLVDYDAEILRLARTEFSSINENSLDNARVKVFVEDAWDFVEKAIADGSKYDVIISDLTVPQDGDGCRFHSVDWYEKLKVVLRQGGVVAVNAASPCNTPRAYWSIFNSLMAGGLFALPYRVYIPSFDAHDYGADWGFILGSDEAIKDAEFCHGMPLAQPRSALVDVEHLRKLFVFPDAVVASRMKGIPGADGSEVLLHYLFNDEPADLIDVEEWNALEVDSSLLMIPEPERGKYVLPPEIRSALSLDVPGQENDLFNRVIELVPALRRFQTRGMIRSFLDRPAAFLDAIDLPGLVSRLLRRAAELPSRVVAELKLLHEKLLDWTGNYLDLFAWGNRILTIVTVVVILGNLMYPDVAYGKGEHGGGGGHGDHGGGDRGGRGGDRGGDRGDRGDRGFDRGDRGFDRGDRGFDHHWDHFGHWGGYHDWHSWRHWGGWARPWHTWYGGGWGGGWAVPYYAGGGGFLNLNFTNNQQDGRSVDEQGNQYPARQYQYQQNVQNYNYGDESAQVAEQSGDAGGGNGTTQQAEGDYRLGPDTDILPGGKIAIQLTDQAYMMITPAGTQIMDQASGKSVMTLANDPSMLYQLASEIKRQSLGLQSASQSRQSNMNWSGKLGFQNQNPEGQQEVANMNGTVALLNQALQSLGNVPDSPPPPTAAPVPNAIEVFASVWMTPDGNYFILRRPNGSLAYMGAKEWFSDQGVTRIRAPYPTQFKSVAVAYLQSLQKEASAEQSSLQQDQQEAQDRLQQLTQRFQNMQANAAGGNSGAQVNLGGGGGPNGGGGGRQRFDGDAGYNSDGSVNPQAYPRLRQAIRRTQNRLDSINNQLNSMPAELAAIGKALSIFQS